MSDLVREWTAEIQKKTGWSAAKIKRIRTGFSQLLEVDELRAIKIVADSVELPSSTRVGFNLKPTDAVALDSIFKEMRMPKDKVSTNIAEMSRQLAEARMSGLNMNGITLPDLIDYLIEHGDDVAHYIAQKNGYTSVA